MRYFTVKDSLLFVPNLHIPVRGLRWVGHFKLAVATRAGVRVAKSGNAVFVGTLGGNSVLETVPKVCPLAPVTSVKNEPAGWLIYLLAQTIKNSATNISNLLNLFFLFQLCHVASNRSPRNP